MSKKQKVVSIPLAQLQVTFFVRRELNEDHVIHLAELYENGVELPPLDIAADTFDIIRGVRAPRPREVKKAGTQRHSHCVFRFQRGVP